MHFHFYLITRTMIVVQKYDSNAVNSTNFDMLSVIQKIQYVVLLMHIFYSEQIYTQFQFRYGDTFRKIIEFMFFCFSPG